MKILFICENYVPHYGGAEVVFKNLAERYTATQHTSTVLTHQLKDTEKKEIINNVQIHRIPSFHSRYLFTFLSIPKAIQLAKQHDIIQTTTFNGAFPAWLAAKLTHKPVALTVHEVWINQWQDITGFGKLKSTIHNLLEHCIYLLPFDHYICVSNATKSNLLKHKPRIDQTKITTIYNGLDYKFWNPKTISEKDTTQLKEKHNLKDKYVCLAYGRPGPSKGFEYLIQAFPKIKQEIPNAHLMLLLGSVDKYPQKYHQLLTLINQHSLQNHSTILTSVPHQELKSYLKTANCIIVPSVAEGFGYTAIEANTLGIPTLISNAGSLPEVISGKYHMFESKNVLDLAEKVVLISKNKHWQKPLKQFNWDDSVEKYLKIYNNLKEKKQTPTSLPQPL